MKTIYKTFQSNFFLSIEKFNWLATKGGKGKMKIKYNNNNNISNSYCNNKRVCLMECKLVFEWLQQQQHEKKKSHNIHTIYGCVCMCVWVCILRINFCCNQKYKTVTKFYAGIDRRDEQLTWMACLCLCLHACMGMCMYMCVLVSKQYKQLLTHTHKYTLLLVCS